LKYLSERPRAGQGQHSGIHFFLLNSNCLKIEFLNRRKL
jgi:hypothetical protein